MAVFQINRPAANGDAYSIAVNGVDHGSQVNAADFRSVGKLVSGLSSTFGDAVNNIREVAAEMTTPAAKVAAIKPQTFDA